MMNEEYVTVLGHVTKFLDVLLFFSVQFHFSLSSYIQSSLESKHHDMVNYFIVKPVLKILMLLLVLAECRK